MITYSKLQRTGFFQSILVFLSIVIIMVSIWGCGSDDNQNISGRVTSGGASLSGVQITMTGDTTTTTTSDTNGNYTFENVSSGTVTLAPSLSGYLFSPPYRTFILLGVDLAGFTFSGYISGRLATSYHSVYLESDGTVWTWGNNSNGQLGDGTTSDEPIPVPVGVLTGITVIAAGSNHTVALKNDGTVWAWGSNNKGQLGDGTTTDRWTPVPVAGLTGITAIDAGSNHSVALKNDGTVWAWGSNSNGQLGNGTTTDNPTPIQVTGMTYIVDIAAGDTHTIALRSVTPMKNDGIVWAWGNNSSGQLGDGTTTNRLTPIQVAGLSGITDITAGDNHNVALRNLYTTTNDGTLWAWGLNSNGQLGDGTTINRLTPVQVAGLSIVTTIAGGTDHSIALKSDGTVWAWGNNDKGQIGDGTTTERLSLVQVTGLTGVTAIASGYKNNVVLKSDGTLQAWGYNNKGQLGDGTTTDRWTPTTVLMP